MFFLHYTVTTESRHPMFHNSLEKGGGQKGSRHIGCMQLCPCVPSIVPAPSSLLSFIYRTKSSAEGSPSGPVCGPAQGFLPADVTCLVGQALEMCCAVDIWYHVSGTSEAHLHSFPILPAPELPEWIFDNKTCGISVIFSNSQKIQDYGS